MKRIKEKVKQVLPTQVWSFFVTFRNSPKLIKSLIITSVLFLCNNRFICKGFNYFFRIRKLEVRKFIPFLEYCIKNENDCKILNKRDIAYSYALPTFWPNKNLKEINSIIVENCIDVIVGSAQIIGNSNLILPSNQAAIYELKYFDKNSKYNYTDEGIEAFNSKLALVKYSKTPRRIEKGIKLTANYSWNYYHLMFDALSKFYYIEESGISDDVPLLIDRIVMNVPQYKELLNMFNTVNRDIIPIEKGEKCFVKQLYCFTDGHVGPPNYLEIDKVLPDDNLFDTNALFFTRETLIKYKSRNSFPKRIFISRKNASIRRRYNEEEVFMALKPFGFEMVFPENHTISEQITIFNEADFILGTTGAAFSNILFCKPQCKVLCFTNYKQQFSSFSTLARFVGVEMFYFYDKNLNFNKRSYIHDSFQVDIPYLQEFINENINVYT